MTITIGNHYLINYKNQEYAIGQVTGSKFDTSYKVVEFIYLITIKAVVFYEYFLAPIPVHYLTTISSMEDFKQQYPEYFV